MLMDKEKAYKGKIIRQQYEININSIKTIEDIKIILKTLNITVSEGLINDENKHLFTDTYK